MSFTSNDLNKLESKNFWVAEKSDGIRVLFLVLPNPVANEQYVYLIDRHNDYRALSGFFFPHFEHPSMPLRESLIDGELVIDVDPRTKKETLRFLAFDCLVVDSVNIMSKTLDKRYGRLKQQFHRPYEKMMQQFPGMGADQPFQILVKEVALSYNADQVFANIPKLQHGNDGLIFTCASTAYVPATDENILKWKPPSENSIDFKLVLRFPPDARDPSQPDFLAKPFFALHIWDGDDRERGVAKYSAYDEMVVGDEEWEKMKLDGEQIDDRIVEVHWDAEREGWRMMRFRDDKPAGNHRSVVDKIINSIADGVEKDALLARSPSIRAAWKARAGQPNTAPAPAQAPSSSSHSQHRGPPPTSSHPPQPRPLTGTRYGSLGTSVLSKVAGPGVVCGMQR